MNKITNFLCLSFLLIGASVLGMNSDEEQLIKAAMLGNLEKVKELIAQGVSIEAKDCEGWTTLIWAVLKGHDDVCKLLIEKKASVNTKDIDDWTPLILAANSELAGMCRLLLKNNAAVNEKENQGLTALAYASRHDNDDICKLLINAQLNKAAIATFLGIVRKRPSNLPCQMQKDIAKIIARQVFHLAQSSTIEQINELHDEAKAKWLAYVNQQMNLLNK